MKHNNIWIIIIIVILVGLSATCLTMSYTKKQETDSSIVAGEAVLTRAKTLTTSERLENLDEEIANKKKNMSDTSTNSLKAEVESERKLWEMEVDRILTILEGVLGAEEKNALFQEQTNWSRIKESTAIEESAKVSSAAGKELEYNRSLTAITRDRAYELERKYRNYLSEDLEKKE